MQDHPKFRKDDAGNLLLNFGEYGGSIDLAAFSGDGRRLLTVQRVGVAQIWDTEQFRLVQELRPTSPLDGSDAGPTTGAFETFIESAALNFDGSLALLGLNDGSAGVFSVETGERLSRMKEPYLAPEAGRRARRKLLQAAAAVEDQWEPIRAACFSPDGSRIALGHFERCVSIWDGAGQRCLQHLRPASSRRKIDRGPRDTMVSCVSISADNRYLYAGCSDGTACIWDLVTEATVLDAVDHVARIVELFVAEDRVLWATSDGNVWQAERDQPPRKVLATGMHWCAAAFSPSGASLLTRTGREEIDQWTLDGQSHRLAVVNEGWGFRDDLRPFAFGRSEQDYCHLKTKKSLVVAHAGHAVEIECQSKFEELLFPVKHNLLVLRTWGKQVEVWSFPDGTRQGLFPCPNGACSVALSHDGRLLACGASGSGQAGDTSPIRIFRIADGQQIALLEGHIHQVHGLAFGPDDQWLVSTSLDRSARRWELAGESSWESKRIVAADLAFSNLNVLSDGRVLLYFHDRIEVWDRLERRLLELPARIRYGEHAVISPDEERVLLTRGGLVDERELRTSKQIRVIRPEMPRPLHLPTQQLHQQIRAVAGASVWQYAGCNFMHRGDGPRGWVTPLSLSGDGQLIVIPCEAGAALVTVEAEPRVLAMMPFQGTLRASWITREKVKLVNSEGELFRWG